MIINEKTIDKKVVQKMEEKLNKTNFKRGRDSAIQGLQLQRGYLEHWDTIRETTKEYGVHMNRIGPVITKQAHEQILTAKAVTERIKKDKKIREMASSCAFPIRSIFYDGDDPEKIVDGVIFLMVFRLLSEFNVRYGKKDFLKSLENGNSEECLEKLFSAEGVTIKDTEKDVDKTVEKLISLIEKKSYNEEE